MESPLVVGVDGSEPSLRATDWAADEAQRHGLSLRLVHASLWERYEGVLRAGALSRSDGRVLAENIVGTAAERVRRRTQDVGVTTEVLLEDPVRALLREGLHASALVTGVRGRGEIAGLLLGSVSLAVAAGAHCPVIVVRGDAAGLAGTHERILLGIGGADVDTAAVRFAFEEARVRGCVLDVVRAWRRPAHEQTSHPLLTGSPARYDEEGAVALLEEALKPHEQSYPEVRVRRATVEGPARKVLLARSAASDLLVIGARRRGGQAGVHLGRVGHTVLHHAACPVAVVPQSS
ncbi:universal stress protein [Streptomyces finlayi]|uniref:Universal stress protein n=1 Tax=Streptomyces finlayi TaxID=67296 RepID=A0A7G7BDG7_9ACTN|nr:universal stress protein [Streptomyces finlayi]QNE73382.1 universal stress protein [Streptomyces finlayi]